MGVIAFVLKPIFAIPLWLTMATAKWLLKFFRELLDILAYRARWPIVAGFWILVLYLLIKLDPYLSHYLQDDLRPIYYFYNTFLITMMFLMIGAFVTSKMRRSWRFTKRQLILIKTAQQAITEGRQSMEVTSGALNRLVTVLSRQRERIQTAPGENGNPNADPEESYEAAVAKAAADAQAAVEKMTSGEKLKSERKPWNLGLDKKPRRGTGGKRAKRDDKYYSSKSKKDDSQSVADELEELAEKIRKLQGKDS
jgi:hypothetical protein